jgi:hypothetical protein
MVAGDHVPEYPSMEVAGKLGAEAVVQSGPIAENVAVVGAEIVMLIVVLLAHCPASGVNVYTVVPTLEVLIVLGDHEPVMFSSDEEWKVGATAFKHSGPIGLNVGVTFGLTVMVIVAVVAH